MDIGVALPTTVHGAEGNQLVEFGRRAEHLGFATVSTVDRLVYDNYDGIVALAAVAAVTERIRLATTILLAAYRPSVVELAKQLASLDRISCGRLTVGLSSGARDDDYLATGTDPRTRGERLDTMIDALQEVWQGAGPVPGVGPRPVSGSIPLLIGGQSQQAMARAARSGIGWISPGGPPQAFPALVEKARQAWADAGRTDLPRVATMCYVSLGEGGKERADAHMLSYYAYMGSMAEHLAKGAISDEAQLRWALEGYAEAGCDEVYLLPCTADPDQLDLVAKAALA